MSKSDVLKWFVGSAQSLTVEKILMVLCLALIMGALIFVTYKYTYSGVCYNVAFNSSNLIIVLITAIIMLMIGSNIAISLGMVGALSIVRFRTAIKDPTDTVYIFWAIVEGLCVGAGIYQLAIIAGLFVALVIFAMNFYTRMQNKYIIIIRGSADVNKDEITTNLNTLFKKAKLCSVNSRENSVEIIAKVIVNGELDISSIDKLNAVAGVKSANWVLESKSNI